MDTLTYLFYIISALAPSIVWLLFYLAKDQHPEPKKKILEVFFLGVIIAILVAVLEVGILKFINIFFSALIITSSIWFLLFKYFFIIAMIEEMSKYLIVRKFILYDSAIDEPLDIMLYLIVAALGFATLENFLLIFNVAEPSGVLEILKFSNIRFIGATFFHTLASGAFGFFIALSLCSEKNKISNFFLGFAVAVFSHGLYNFCIAELSGILEYLIPIIIIASLSIFTTFGFIKLKKIKSVCKISV